MCQISKTMKRIFRTLLVLIIPFVTHGQSPKNLIVEFNQFIQGLQSIEYDMSDYYSVTNENSSAACLFDFTHEDSEIGTRYHFKVSGQHHVEQIYSGNESNKISHTTNQIIIKQNLTPRDSKSSWYMQNSILVLRRILPIFLEDPLVKYEFKNDTIINNESCFSVLVVDRGRVLGLGGDLRKSSDSSQIYKYEIVFAKDDLRPLMFSRIYTTGDYWRATYDNVLINKSINKDHWSSPYEADSPSYYPTDYEMISFEDWILRKKNRLKSTIGRKLPIGNCHLCLVIQ
jgi:hypothetical protein